MTLEVCIKTSSQGKSRSCFKVTCCFATQQNRYSEKNRSFSNTKQPLFINSLSVTLQSSFMHWCTIQIFTHDPTHNQQNSYHHNHIISSNVATHQTPCLSYYIVLPPLHSILSPSPRLPLSPTFHHSNPSLKTGNTIFGFSNPYS